MRRAQLDAMYASGTVNGELPDGNWQGKVVLLAGTPLAPLLTALIRLAVWSGKLCDGPAGVLVNKWGPGGMLHLIRGYVRIAPTRAADGGKCIEIDYSSVVWPVCLMRDEVRLIAPAQYLGLIFFAGLHVGHFILENPTPAPIEHRRGT